MEKLHRWQMLKQIVGSALELPAEEWAPYLDQACSQDSELRKEVESLLSAYKESDRLSETPWQVDAPNGEAEPRVVGPYRLLKELGIGGMGQVWLAEQTEPVRRQVALKLIRAGMYDSATVRRFKAERQSLAIMDHPAIAKVFDAGTTPAGQPYLAMEYVDGLPITDYCDSKKLSIRDRLQLFLRVCEGVQHAHQKAIIHRDLKPSNILVVEVDGKPMPRIIDFGLAKATVPLALGETLFTQMGAFLGTPGYMSPEQADPEVHDIDTRTDVYSLGAILYELLTGFLPFDTTEWKKQRPEEYLRKLREEDPPRPSTKVSTNRDTSTGKAQARNTEVKQLTSQLRGDLDWITMKALEKDRERRYATPSALAADLDNYLSNRPVTARPASVAYRARKYVRRHAAGVAVATAAVTLLVAFAIVQAAELRRITRERDRADRITEFMTNMFKVADPSEARGNSITAREILDKSAKEIDTGLAKDPELQAQMMDVMGHVYTSIGLYQKGAVLLSRAVESRRRVLGPSNPDTLKSMGVLAWNSQLDGRYCEAEKLGRETLNAERRVLGQENRETLKTERELAWTLSEQGKYPEAEQLFRHTLEIQRRALGPEDRETILTMSLLGWTMSEEGKYAEAEKMEREALDTGRRGLGPLNPVTLVSMGDLAGILQAEQRYPDADKLFREMIQLYTSSRGPEDPTTLTLKANLADVLQHEGNYDEAAHLLRETFEVQRRTVGAEHPTTLSTAMAMGYSLGALGHYEEGQKLLFQTRDIQRRLFGPDSPQVATTTYNLAALESRRGRRDEAFAFLRDAVEHGLPPADDFGIETELDFKPLHDDPRFAAIVAEAKKLADRASRPN